MRREVGMLSWTRTSGTTWVARSATRLFVIVDRGDDWELVHGPLRGAPESSQVLGTELAARIRALEIANGA